MDFALAEEQKCLIGSSSEDARLQQKLFKRKHPVLGLEQTDEFNLNKKFVELQTKTGISNVKIPSSQKISKAKSKNLSKKTPKDCSSNKKTALKNSSNYTPTPRQKRRIESDDDSDDDDDPIIATLVQKSQDSNSDSDLDVDRRCANALKRIDNFAGNLFKRLLLGGFLLFSSFIFRLSNN